MRYISTVKCNKINPKLVKNVATICICVKVDLFFHKKTKNVQYQSQLKLLKLLKNSIKKILASR